MAKHGDYTTFIYTANNRYYSFATYTDYETGREVGFIEGYDKNQMPIYRRWKFDTDVRHINIHKNMIDKDKEGPKSAIEFLRKSPHCAGSPQGTYTGNKDQLDVYFRENNEEATAQIGLDAEVKRIEAQNLALKVKGQDFIDLCALIGVFNKDESVMRFSLVDYAKNKPQSFLEIAEDPKRKAKSLIRQATNTGIFDKEGTMLTWEKNVIGFDEDDAVSKLLKDDNLMKAIKAQVDKSGK